MHPGSLKSSNFDVHPKNDGIDRSFEQITELAKAARRSLQIVQEAGRADGVSFSQRLQLSGRLILGNDIAGLILSFGLAGLCAWGIDTHLIDVPFQRLVSNDTARQTLGFALLGFVAILWLDAKGHYRQRLPYWEAVGHIVTVTLVGLIGSGFIQFAFKDSSSRLWTSLSWLMFGSSLFMSRVLVRRGLHRRGLWEIPALMIGTGQTAKAVLAALNKNKAMGFRFVDHIPATTLDSFAQSQAWESLLHSHDACQVFLALEGGELEKQQAALKSLAMARIPCSIVPPWFGLPCSTLSSHHFLMQDILLLHDTKRLELPLPRLLKRSFDCIVSAVLLVLLAPVFAVIAFLVSRDGGPAIFSQPRVGRYGQLFQCYKFRSMRVDAEQILATHLAENPEASAEWLKFQKLKNDVRVTRFGQFIRRISLDELPQLFNVFKGDMSLVGPRPILRGQESLYADDIDYYTAVRPGITGPWQVSGRNQLTFAQRVELESWYTRNWSLWLDIVILLKTIPALLEKGQAF